MSLKEILKNKSFVKVFSVFLLLASTGLVYFLGFNLSKEFSSTTVLEYRFSGVEVEEAKKTVSEIKQPTYIERTEEGRLLFYFKNIKPEEIEQIDNKIGEKYKYLLEKNTYQVEPIIDSDLGYRYLNIFFIGLAGSVVLTIFRFRGGMKAVQLAGMNLVFLMSFVFELIIILGFMSFASLMNLQLDITAIQALLFLFITSFFVKFILSMRVYEKVKERKSSLLDAWLEGVREKKRILIDSLVLITFMFVLLFVFIPGFRFAVMISEASLLILGFTTFKLIPELFSFKLRNK